MKTVKFTEMKKGSKEDYELLAEYEKNSVSYTHLRAHETDS